MPIFIKLGKIMLNFYKITSSRVKIMKKIKLIKNSRTRVENTKHFRDICNVFLNSKIYPELLRILRLSV